MRIDQNEFERFLTIKQKLAPKSVKSYLYRYRIFINWLEENNYSLSKNNVERFLYEKKTDEELGNLAVNTYIQALHHFEAFCKDRNLQTGFMEGINSLPKTHPEIVILSEEEINKLRTTKIDYKNRNGVDCSDLNLKYLTLIDFHILTGCRFQEAASLLIKRIDIPNGKATLVNTKNKQNRYVYFDGPIKENLIRLTANRKPDDLVFTNSRGTMVKAGEFNEDLKRRAKKAGITKRVHAHLLRHCFGTQMVESGVDISITAKLLGHKDIQTTYDTYVHLADKTLQKAAQKHPLMRQFVEPKEVLKNIEESVNKLLENDSRFEKNIFIDPNTFEIKIGIRLIQ